VSAFRAEDSYSQVSLSSLNRARRPPVEFAAGELGFTVIELLITCALILTVAALAVPNLLSALNAAKIARAVADVHAIGTDVMGYDATENKFPDTLDDVGDGAYRDPWGNPYQYLSFSTVKGKGKMRKDRFLVPINTSFDLYSMGKDDKSAAPLTAQASQDDVIWANDGSFVGLASQY
jgi:general secretion pathway protein G